MLYNPPSGSTDANAPYVGKNVAAGTQGSKVPPEAVEYTQREIVAAIVASGQNPTNTVLAQAAMALGRGIWVGNLTGSGDLAVATLGVVLPSLLQGMRIGAVATATNASAAPRLRVVNLASVNGYVDFPIIKEDGTSVSVGYIKVGQQYRFEIDGNGNARIIKGLTLAEIASSGLFPVVTTASTTLYVRTDGNDATADGSANTSAKAFATVFAAVTYGTSRFSLAGGTLVIQLGVPGTYAAPNIIPPTLGTLIIQGDTNNQNAYALGGAGPSAGTPPFFALGGKIITSGLVLSNTGTINHTLNAAAGAQITCQYTTFSSAGNGGFFHTQAAGGSVTFGPGCIIASSMAGIGAGIGGGSINIAANLQLSNTPNFSDATFVASDRGGFALTPGYGFTGTGATGRRYRCDLGGIGKVFGAGANALPGSTAGAADNTTGGYYA